MRITQEQVITKLECLQAGSYKNRWKQYSDCSGKETEKMQMVLEYTAHMIFCTMHM